MLKFDFKCSVFLFFRISLNWRSFVSLEEEYGFVIFFLLGFWNKLGMEEKDWKWIWIFLNDLVFFFSFFVICEILMILCLLNILI